MASAIRCGACSEVTEPEVCKLFVAGEVDAYHGEIDVFALPSCQQCLFHPIGLRRHAVEQHNWNVSTVDTSHLARILQRVVAGIVGGWEDLIADAAGRLELLA